MLEIYRSADASPIPSRIDTIQSGCWVRMIHPTEDEIAYVCTTLSIPREDIITLLDDEESPRIEHDDGRTLIIVDTPYVDTDDTDPNVSHPAKTTGTTSYTTVPAGFIVMQDTIITVSLRTNPVLQTFIDGKVKNFSTVKKTRFLLQFLYRNARLFVQHLRQIDNLTSTIEHTLYKSTRNEELIELVREEVTAIPKGRVVIAAGPLCSPALSEAVLELVGGSSLSFFDAAAPIVDAESLDRSVLFRQSRYGETEVGDYLNAPFTKEEYEAFIDALVAADRVVLKDFEHGGLFQACQPAEEVARTGRDALRFGAMKPVGLTDPRTGRRPWAALQLRAENREGTAYNLVGFQTNLTFGEQKRVFHMVPGLQNAEFFRYGVMHRNTFVDAPHVLDSTFAVPGTQVRLAGQITGTEGYTEAIASGLLAALNTYADLIGAAPVALPKTGALGALVAYATDPATEDYQPMHVNFGLVPPLEDGVRRGKRDRYRAYADRALADFDAYLATRDELFPMKGASR